MGGLASNASDGFAIAMLGVIFLSWSVLLLLFWSMRRRVAKRDEEVESLLEEIEAKEDKRPIPKREGPKRSPWERNPDWWKRG